MTPEVEAATAILRAHPSRTALLFDFDGTLSAVVDDPAAARPLPGVADLLAELAHRYRTVAVISGRPVSFLVQHLPDDVVLSGLYGLELRHEGRIDEPEGAPAWREAVSRAAARAAHEAAPGGPLDGMVVEPKGLSLTLHVRTRPHLAADTLALARSLADELGLEVRPAKMSVELHPPVEADKGSALRQLAEGAAAVLYVGDDVGDLPAFAALRELGGAGIDTVALAIGGPELPGEVAAAASAVLADQAAAVELLRALLV